MYRGVVRFSHVPFTICAFPSICFLGEEMKTIVLRRKYKSVYSECHVLELNLSSITMPLLPLAITLHSLLLECECVVCRQDHAFSILCRDSCDQNLGVWRSVARLSSSVKFHWLYVSTSCSE